MNLWLLNIGAVLVINILLTSVMIPLIIQVAFCKNLFDMPNGRKIHTSLVPRLGGIAFKPVICFSLAIIVGINLTSGNEIIFSSFFSEAETLSYILAAMMILYLVGIGDDLVGVRYRGKFISQTLSALILIIGRLQFNNFHGLLGIYSLPLWFTFPMTILVIIFIINAINLIDGIDGLASGLCSIIFLYYGIIFYIIDQPVYSFLSFSILGVLVPFFYYNVFGNEVKRNKIFMGDTGSLTIGVLICALSIKLEQYISTANQDLGNPLVLTYSPLIIPCFDVIRVYFSRLKRGKNPFMPDRSHIHHKLLDTGMGKHAAMITIIIASILFTIFNILLSPYINITILLLLDGFIWIFVNLWLTKFIKSKVSSK